MESEYKEYCQAFLPPHVLLLLMRGVGVNRKGIVACRAQTKSGGMAYWIERGGEKITKVLNQDGGVIMGKENAQEKATKLLTSLVQAEEMERTLSEYHKAIDVMRRDLYDAMTDEGVDSLKVNGIEFKPHIETVYALADEHKGMKWDDLPAWFKWLETNGLADIIKTVRSVHQATRTKVLREWQDQGGELPEFVKEQFYNSVKYNKSAISRLVDGRDA